MNRLIILIFTIILSIPSIAQDGNYENILIRGDRVWVAESWLKGKRVVKYMKFMEARDFMDQTYTRVATIKRVTWTETLDDITNIEIEDNIDETEGWMREENGKVYLLLDGWVNYTLPDFATDLTEGLIYDFNADDTSTFEGISMYRYYENYPVRYFEGWYRVSSMGKEIVGDEEVKCWDVKFKPLGDNEESSSAYRIVEGIGIIEYGCLFYIETFEHTSYYNFFNDFCCCLDLDGKILYPKDYDEELPGGGLSSVSEVSNDELTLIYTEKRVSAPGCIIEVYDLTGKIVCSGIDQLSTIGFPQGIYILKTSGRGPSKTMKIVIPV